MQFGGLLAVRNRRVSILQSNPLWGPRQNLAVPCGMIATSLIAVTNLYGPGLRKVFFTTAIPGMFWGLPFTFALGILTMDELRKLIVRTYPKVGPSLTFGRVGVYTNEHFIPVYHCQDCMVIRNGIHGTIEHVQLML